MKTIRFELAKRLDEAGLLENIETEYVNITDWSIFERDGEPNPNTYIANTEELLSYNDKYNSINDIINDENSFIEVNYKTLTLEEAIEFLGELNIDGPIPGYKGKIKKNLRLHISNLIGYGWYLEYINNGLIYIRPDLTDKKLSLIEAIEQMIEYLLDNNILGQENN